MKSWDDYRLVCVHGVRENLDDHPCSECYKLAEKDGKDLSNGKTYLYKSIPTTFTKKA
jgi:hypothetical protein